MSSSKCSFTCICGIFFFHNYSLCSVCILPQSTFYSQAAVCILHSVCILPLVRSLQSAVRSLRFTLTGNFVAFVVISRFWFCLSWLRSMCVVSVSAMPYFRFFRFFRKCRANWVRQGTRRLKVALKSLKCLFFCSYFCSYFIIIIIIIIIIIAPRIFYTFYVALENSKTFSH